MSVYFNFYLKDTHMDLPQGGSLSKFLQQPKMCQTKTGSQEHNPTVCSPWVKGTQWLNWHICLGVCIDREQGLRAASGLEPRCFSMDVGAMPKCLLNFHCVWDFPSSRCIFNNEVSHKNLHLCSLKNSCDILPQQLSVIVEYKLLLCPCPQHSWWKVGVNCCLLMWLHSCLKVD